MSDITLSDDERLSKMSLADFKRHYIHKRSAYTLVELITVIAIIAVIASIILPIFIKIRESVKITSCISNMRQIGTSLGWYMEDYDERFPSAAPWGSPKYWNSLNQYTIQELLYPYINSGMVYKNGRYIDGGAFRCPSDCGIPSEIVTETQIYGVPVEEPIWKYTGCSYEYYASNQTDWLNWQINPPEKPWTALSPQILMQNHLERVGAPSEAVIDLSTKAVMGDTYFWHLGDREPNGRVAYLNTLYADGHAARVNTITHIKSRLQPLYHWHNHIEINR